MAILPMFPLGTVALPGTALPLHVFEPRYQALVHDCAENAPHEFGVVLIERGSEVGGGDQRTGVGTAMRLVQVARLGGGRFAMVAVGVRRVRVVEWLPDSPYPRADVEDWPDDDATTDGLSDRLHSAAARVRRVAALALELGDPVPRSDHALSDDPVLGSYQLASRAPLADVDRHALLAAPGVAARFDLLDTQLDDVEELQRLRLEAGMVPPDHPGEGRGTGPDGD